MTVTDLNIATAPHGGRHRCPLFFIYISCSGTTILCIVFGRLGVIAGCQTNQMFTYLHFFHEHHLLHKDSRWTTEIGN